MRKHVLFSFVGLIFFNFALGIAAGIGADFLISLRLFAFDAYFLERVAAFGVCAIVVYAAGIGLFALSEFKDDEQVLLAFNMAMASGLGVYFVGAYASGVQWLMLVAPVGVALYAFGLGLSRYDAVLRRWRKPYQPYRY